MHIGSSSSILNELLAGNLGLTGGVAALSRQQALENTQLLLQIYALKAATELQEAAALALIQSMLGVGQNVDYFA